MTNDPQQPNWDEWADFPGLASVLDPNDASGAKNAIIDKVQWGALKNRIAPGDLVLDFGCGTGRFGLRTQARGARYVGVDYSHQMVRKALEDHPHSGLEFARFDGERLPFADNTFDKCICCGVFQYYSQTAEGQAMMSELSRVLKPSGRILIIDQVSRSGQTSGTVKTSTTERQLCAQLRPMFVDHTCKAIRRGRASIVTSGLLRLGNIPSWAVTAAAWIEWTAIRLMRNGRLAGQPYYDVLIDAAPVKSVQYFAGNNPI